jgi:hypothetical protein
LKLERVQELASRFNELFKGSEAGHGEYQCYEVDPESQKMAGQARTVRGPVTTDMWAEHLRGDLGLGVIPIDKMDECVWGCIDIDDYHGFDHKSLIKEIKKLKYPLVVCRSKSGGAHIFLFTEEPVPAEKMRETLRKVAARLGHGGDTEVFPKQNKVLHERGDLGNWLNMPYQDIPSITTRYGLHPNTGKVIADPYEFLDYCDSRKVSFAEMLSLVGSPDKKIEIRGGNPFKYGFPCLEIMYENGVPEGGRNNVIFTMGVQMQIMYPGNWEEKFDQMVPKMLKDNALPAVEVANIKKSIEKKEYGPKCEIEPMCSHCDKSTCRIRKHGIGANSNFALIENIVKIPTDPVIWFADVNGERTEFESEDLLNQRKFRRKVLDEHNIFPPLMKDGQWSKQMSKLLQECEIQQTYEGTSREEMFFDLLQEFCTRKQAKNKDELLRGIPWQEDGYIYFKMANFNAFLIRNKYMHFNMPQRNQRIRNIRGGSKYIKVSGKTVNVWYVPVEYFNSSSSKYELPPLEGGAI